MHCRPWSRRDSVAAREEASSTARLVPTRARSVGGVHSAWSLFRGVVSHLRLPQSITEVKVLGERTTQARKFGKDLTQTGWLRCRNR